MKAIVAMDPNRVIGCKGKIPWYIAEDTKWFHRLTMGIPHERAIHVNKFNSEPTQGGGILVMGRTTYKTVGILPGRYTYVLTNEAEKLALPSTHMMKYVDLDYILANLKAKGDTHDFFDCLKAEMIWKRMWVCGGAKTYYALLPFCEEVFVTHIIEEYDGDTEMPEFENKFPNQELLRETKDYSIVRYWI